MGIFHEHLGYQLWNPNYMKLAGQNYEEASKQEEEFAKERRQKADFISTAEEEELLMPRLVLADGVEAKSKNKLITFIHDEANQKNHVVKYVCALAFEFALNNVDCTQGHVEKHRERLIDELARDGFAPALIRRHKEDYRVMERFADKGEDLAQLYHVLHFLHKSEDMTLEDFKKKFSADGKNRLSIEKRDYDHLERYLKLLNREKSMVRKFYRGLLISRGIVASDETYPNGMELIREAAKWKYDPAINIQAEENVTSVVK